MKHKLKISVANESPKGGIVTCKKKKVKRGLFKRLFGIDPDKVTIIIPGDSVQDVTEFRLAFGKVYLSPVIDFYTQRVVSYSISQRPVLKQAMDMLDKLEKTGLIRPGITVLHSDQRWQYRHKMYQSWVLDHGIRQSMSRLDNSPTENFFGLLKKEMFYGHEYEYTDYHSFRKALEKYIRWYNSERIKLRLHMSPDQYQSTSSA